jgi:hypothetical protein
MRQKPRKIFTRRRAHGSRRWMLVLFAVLAASVSSYITGHHVGAVTMAAEMEAKQSRTPSVDRTGFAVNRPAMTRDGLPALGIYGLPAPIV